MSNPKHTNWVFTLNNYSEEDVERLLNLPSEGTVKYVLFGKEVAPTTGTPHLQGLVIFRNKVRRSTCQKAIHPDVPMHVEIMRSLEGSIAYNRKEGDWYEAGVAPVSQSDKGKKEKERYRQAKRAAEEGDFDAIDPDIYLRHYSTIKRIRHDKLTERKLHDTVEQHEWYYGPAGTGKSRKAREENPDAYLKNCNKWWDGYVDQAVVIVDDFDQAHSVLVHHLKHWADRYPFQAEVKGSAMKIRPGKMIVTSNYHPRDIWTDERDLNPILRRFKVTHFPSLGSVPINPPLPQENQEEGSDQHVLVEHGGVSQPVIDLTQ